MITPALTTTPELATSLAPPTIPLWVTLQPPTCPGYLNQSGDNGACLQGAAPANAAIGAIPAPLTCTGPVGGIACPTAFIGSWNSVAVDTDQQVYVVGQIGMSSARGTANFGAGLANRLALEMERINPSGTPELIFPNCRAPVTSSLLIDATAGGNNYCQILPTAPPSPDPNQPGGLSCGIAINQFRETFLAGTTTATNPTAPPANTQATATVNVTGGIVNIGICPAGAAGGPACPAGANGGSGYSATTPPPLRLVQRQLAARQASDPFTVTLDANGAITAITPAASGAGCTATGIRDRHHQRAAACRHRAHSAC